MPRKSAKHRQRGPKERGPYTGKPVQARVIADHLAGYSNRRIAREEGIDRKTVDRILTQNEVVERMARYQQELLSLVPKAIGVYDEALSSDDERVRVTVATKLMEGLLVMPRGNAQQIGEMAERALMNEMIFGKSQDLDLEVPEAVAKIKDKCLPLLAGQELEKPCDR
jgi:hypothetical protein